MTMAKTKAVKKRPPPAREASFRLRMSDEFKTWLERYADHRQDTAAHTVTQAIIALAKVDGFEPPPRR